jgi:uroporphyrinogen III methyltransferase/synthase
MSLRDKTILVTRQREQATDLLAGIEARGGRALLLPMISIQDPISWSGADNALRQLRAYDAIVFASTNGVAQFFRRAGELQIETSGLSEIALYAVGTKTQDALQQKGFHVAGMPEEYSAQGLVRYFRTMNVRGKRFLLPRGDRGRSELSDGLMELGATVELVEVYRNVPDIDATASGVWHSLNSGGIDVVIFASPTAAVHFHELLTGSMHLQFPTRTKVAVIGPTTGSALRELGMPVDIVASVSTSEGLLDAIELYFEN